MIFGCGRGLVGRGGWGRGGAGMFHMKRFRLTDGRGGTGGRPGCGWGGFVRTGLAGRACAHRCVPGMNSE